MAWILSFERISLRFNPSRPTQIDVSRHLFFPEHHGRRCSTGAPPNPLSNALFRQLHGAKQSVDNGEHDRGLLPVDYGDYSAPHA